MGARAPPPRRLYFFANDANDEDKTEDDSGVANPTTLLSEEGRGGAPTVEEEKILRGFDLPPMPEVGDGARAASPGVSPPTSSPSSAFEAIKAKNRSKDGSPEGASAKTPPSQRKGTLSASLTAKMQDAKKVDQRTDRLAGKASIEDFDERQQANKLARRKKQVSSPSDSSRRPSGKYKIFKFTRGPRVIPLLSCL